MGRPSATTRKAKLQQEGKGVLTLPGRGRRSGAQRGGKVIFRERSKKGGFVKINLIGRGKNSNQAPAIFQAKIKQPKYGRRRARRRNRHAPKAVSDGQNKGAYLTKQQADFKRASRPHQPTPLIAKE